MLREIIHPKLALLPGRNPMSGGSLAERFAQRGYGAGFVIAAGNWGGTNGVCPVFVRGQASRSSIFVGRAMIFVCVVCPAVLLCSRRFRWDLWELLAFALVLAGRPPVVPYGMSWAITDRPCPITT